MGLYKRMFDYTEPVVVAFFLTTMSALILVTAAFMIHWTQEPGTGAYDITGGIISFIGSNILMLYRPEIYVIVTAAGVVAALLFRKKRRMADPGLHPRS